MPPASFLSPSKKRAPHSWGRWRPTVPGPPLAQGSRGRAPAHREPQPHSQDAKREGSRHALAVSDQEAAIAACPGQQLLRGSAAQVAVVPGGGRAAQSPPRARAPRGRRPARRSHDQCKAQSRPRPPPGAILSETLGAEAGGRAGVPGLRIDGRTKLGNGAPRSAAQAGRFVAQPPPPAASAST